MNTNIPQLRRPSAANRQRTNSLGVAGRPRVASLRCAGTFSEAKPGGPDKARRSYGMEGSAMHQPGESPGTFSSSLPGDAVPQDRSAVAGTGSDSTESGKPQALHLDAVRGGVIAPYRGDSRERPATFSKWLGQRRGKQARGRTREAYRAAKSHRGLTGAAISRFSARPARATYPRHHLLIASLCCFAVVILIGVILI